MSEKSLCAAQISKKHLQILCRRDKITIIMHKDDDEDSTRIDPSCKRAGAGGSPVMSDAAEDHLPVAGPNRFCAVGTDGSPPLPDGI